MNKLHDTNFLAYHTPRSWTEGASEKAQIPDILHVLTRERSITGTRGELTIFFEGYSTRFTVGYTVLQIRT
ncbi:uncharacterized protein ANIA_11514 [Aspergillus nidulans FGSC A4]|uniref:Uncharacterized protein n=1 Tax=Emericella nidulans (strain FGSC A4 / ATCC 38163 / CBS 112.46 / NRRL 194 / M139) TaxID=227321 RepID=C8V059_EMENI|nr:hypothetical protein [Aspergillus nidulans FGSC A4]CBF69399.1 TPA: hypothetical protein ANIA_11514 [Aspergillus nidulans FGSC A4]